MALTRTTSSDREYTVRKPRITQAEKDSNDFQWYKDMADLLDSQAFSENNFVGFNGVSEYKRKKVNYDLFNNIIDTKEFEYVCRPYGAETGDLPANMTNRDIVSGKIKVLLGMEMKMPFSWKVLAVNEEATTRKEQEESRRLREFVEAEIMNPIRTQIQQQALAQQKGRELSPEEKQQIEQQIQAQIKAQTPPEIRKYMLREHQDPAEVQTSQLLEYVVRKQDILNKFNKGFKHLNLSGEEVYLVTIINGEPCVEVVNTLFFDYDKSPDSDNIEDGEWAVYEMRMLPSEVIAKFGSQLKDEEIDRIYNYINNPSRIWDESFTFETDRTNDPFTIRVIHCAFKALRKIGFLTYTSKRTGETEMMIVDETYKLNKAQGDINIEWEWIPESHEVYKIFNDIYAYPRPVPGQYKDLDNLYICKLPYIGVAMDNLNSPITSSMDRMKAYQYFYDVIIYRTELLLASDKGKILAVNINAIPKSAGIDIAKWQYFMEANKIVYLNPTEEGNKGMGDVTNLVKEVDMSLVAQIDNYIKLAEYIDRRCGSSIGVTPQMEAQIGPNEAVSNTRQNLVQSSHIIQPIFELHNIVKGNVLTAVVETSKVAYSQDKPAKLGYVLDDMSSQMLNIDQWLLDGNTYGLFISNSSKAADAKQLVETLAQAALQNQQTTLSDLIKIVRSDSVTEAEEMLEASEQRRVEEEQSMEQQKIQAQREAEARQDQLTRDEWAHEERIVIIKERERRKTEIQKQAMFSLGFDPNKDEDDDGVPDVLEVAKFGVDADIKRRKQDLDEEEFAHQQEVDKEKLVLERKKIAAQKNKQSSK